MTLEAVQTCLYYLHVDSPEDEAIRESLEEQRKSDEAETALNAASINRKPLPSAPYMNYPAFQRPPLPPKSYPHYQPLAPESGRDTQVERFAARGNYLRLNISREDGNARFPRKPVGPRARDPPHPEDGQIQIRRKPLGSLSKDDNESLLPDHGIFDDDGNRCGYESDHAVQQSPEAKTLALTLVRRDVVSGNQWNVGRISFPLPTNNGREDAQVISITLTTPGYQRFDKAPFPPDHIIQQYPLLECPSILLPTDVQSSPTNRSSQRSRSPFTRVVSSTARKNSGARHRSNSDDVQNAIRQAWTNGTAGKSRPQFSFISPWHGTCSFTTGVDGRSLRCRHVLPGNRASEDDRGANVAEIRFNLPWLMLKPKDINSQSPPKQRTQEPAESSIPSHHSFAHSIRHLKYRSWAGPEVQGSNSSSMGPLSARSDGIDEIEINNKRLDLSLGRERAGGGFAGKSAKLGKIIIDDEGLKMGDMVVAACMGIWWQQYLAINGEG